MAAPCKPRQRGDSRLGNSRARRIPLREETLGFRHASTLASRARVGGRRRRPSASAPRPREEPRSLPSSSTWATPPRSRSLCARRRSCSRARNPARSRWRRSAPRSPHQPRPLAPHTASAAFPARRWPPQRTSRIPRTEQPRARERPRQRSDALPPVSGQGRIWRPAGLRRVRGVLEEGTSVPSMTSRTTRAPDRCAG